MYKNIDVDYLLRDAEKAIAKQDKLRALRIQEQQIRASWGKSIHNVSRETKRKLLALSVKRVYSRNTSDGILLLKIGR